MSDSLMDEARREQQEVSGGDCSNPTQHGIDCGCVILARYAPVEPPTTGAPIVVPLVTAEEAKAMNNLEPTTGDSEKRRAKRMVQACREPTTGAPKACTTCEGERWLPCQNCNPDGGADLSWPASQPVEEPVAWLTYLLKYGQHLKSCPVSNGCDDCLCGWQVIHGDAMEAPTSPFLQVTEEMVAIGEMAAKHSHRWWDQGDGYWLQRLMQEVGELSGVLAGDHSDTLEHELTQIGSIAANWLALAAAREKNPRKDRENESDA